MQNDPATTDHRKRRRRRHYDRPPISGWLQPSEQVKGNVGFAAHELFSDLFGHIPKDHELADAATGIRYIGITPWAPASQNLVEDAAWTVLPVRAQTSKEEETNKIKPTTIRFPALSWALQTFAEALQAAPTGKSANPGHSRVQVRILPVEPLVLDIVYITVDGDALDKHDEVQKKFGGGFLGGHANGFASKNKKQVNGSAGHANGIGKEYDRQIQDDQLTSAVREAVQRLKVVRQNDMLSLPLPAHPITHVPFPPARVTLCEPVNQGLLSNTTKMVVSRVHHGNPVDRALPSLASKKALHGLTAVDGCDTSNDQFYSAVEDSKASDAENGDTASESDSAEKKSDSSSDDSIEDIISINTPALLTQSSGVLSTKTAATPRASGPRANGINSPGSVYSNFTTTTARQGAPSRSKIFNAQCLVQKVPDDLLHPQPAADDDDEARVFVNIKSLVKIGCYSGDWIKLEGTAKTAGRTPKAWGIEAFGQGDDAENFRPVKVYGLPDLQPAPRNKNPGFHNRRSSVLPQSSIDRAGMTAWLSPILMANLGQPASVTLSMLSPQTTAPERKSSRSANKRSKVSTSTIPPTAREMILLRVSTPLSTERALQIGLFSALKQHFEHRRRILRQGDLIALPVDVGASRLLSQSGHAAEPDQEIEELLSIPSRDHNKEALEAVWFRVGHIVGSDPDESLEDAPDLWGGASCIEPRITRMRQAGSDQSRIPSTMDNTWEYYLGTKCPSKMNPSSHAAGQYATSVPKQNTSSLRRRLRELVAAATSPRALHLGMDPMVILLHSAQRNIGKATMSSQVASDLGVHLYVIDAYDILAEGAGGGDVKTEAFLKARVDRAMSCGTTYTAVLIRHIEALSTDRMVTALREVVLDIRILIATTTELDKVADGVRSLVTHEMELAAPDEGEREGILHGIIESRGLRIGHDVDLVAIALKTAALVAGNLVDIVDRAVTAKIVRLETLATKSSCDKGHIETSIQDILLSGGEYARCVIKSDFDTAVEAARKNFADAIGAPKIPNVSWDDVGGLENVKDAVMETIQLPLERPELFAKGMKKRSGILFYGPPGTGKTLLAKAIATSFSLNFFSIKGPELLNMYIGESEANVRRVFQRARDARPCVVFFDELDSVAPKRGNQGDSGGVMDRIVSQLLAELDGMSDGEEGGGGVFVIGATNRPDLLDQALLRPGRFDKMLYLGVSDTHEKQLTILEALTRKFIMHPELSLHRVAESLPFTYTGADLYALCSDAMLKAITRQAAAVDAKIGALPNGPVTTAYFFDHLATPADIAVMVTEDDFIAAQRELVGSVR